VMSKITDDNFWIFVGLGFGIFDAAYLAHGKNSWVCWSNYER